MWTLIHNASLRGLLLLLMILPQGSSVALAQCDVAGQWRMVTQNVGQSIWTFTPQGSDSYRAQEAGLGAATGQAIMYGRAMHMEWQTRAGWSGAVDLIFDASCMRGDGRQVFFKGRRGSETSSWIRLGDQTFDYPQLNGAAVDWCVNWAANCGQLGADNFCRIKGYRRATSFKTYKPGRTYIIGDNRFCAAQFCIGFAQVVCAGG